MSLLLFCVHRELGVWVGVNWCAPGCVLIARVHVGVYAQGGADHDPVVTAEVQGKPGAQTSHAAIGAAWDAVAHAVAAADVRSSLHDKLAKAASAGA